MSYPKEPCIETIRCTASQLQNLDFHNARMNLTRQLLFGTNDFLNLRELIQIPELLPNRVYKCRVTYRFEIEKVEWELYQKRQVDSLKIICNDTINYPFKFKQRNDLDKIYSQRESYDDVLIVRNGYLTDTYVCNLALFDGDAWLTPATPLLKGTQRENLLQQGVIKTAHLLLTDLHKFTDIRLFNAMIPWEEAITLPVSQIFH